MKKLFSLITTLTLSLGAMAASFMYNADGTQTQTQEGITIKLEKGENTNAPAYSSYNGMKMYANNTITIDAEQAFKNIQLVFSKNENKEYLTMTASEGELVSGGTSTALDDKKIDVWTGNATHLVFTMGTKGQRVIHQIVVDGDPIELNPTTYIDDTPLEADFEYGEPTAILSPDMNFFKKEYAFIESNVRISCTQGSIISNDTAAYFNCNAGYVLSFEAAQNIKAIVIKGAVRKGFSASADHGDITFLTPDEFYPEDYQECDQVLIVKNVNNKTLAVTCVKQIRCYCVYVYFEANPEATIDCGGQTEEGETFFLNFTTADLVYESQISEEEGKPNYTVFLYNAPDEKPYIALDLYPASKDNLAGQYSSENGSLGETSWYQYGESEMDLTWLLDDGQLVINKDGENYSISGYLTCDDANTYNFTFSGPMTYYTDTEYYDNQQEAIDHIPAIDRNAPVYDILGRPVGEGYKGVVFQNGNKYLIR